MLDILWSSGYGLWIWIMWVSGREWVSDQVGKFWQPIFCKMATLTTKFGKLAHFADESYLVFLQILSICPRWTWGLPLMLGLFSASQRFFSYSKGWSKCQDQHHPPNPPWSNCQICQLFKSDNLTKVDVGGPTDLGTLQRLPMVAQSEQLFFALSSKHCKWSSTLIQRWLEAKALWTSYASVHYAAIHWNWGVQNF